ncbi:MAG: DegT/DnrJ/EryC1/StrS family aminotransferase, partial [Deltaproteobacteria bacterium]|nr:DegT/DnrJ/EryC1/StrS family aminotransferase [Deltaproteobacteria bacterium]
EPSWGRRICWVYTLLLPSGCDRDRVIRQLQDRGIDTRPVFYPIHLMPPYQTGEKFPIAESIAARGISLPSSSDLQEGDIGYICDSLLECL